MKYRKLRIAWSVAWGLVAVLLIMLWVRSYTWNDHVRHLHISLSTKPGYTCITWMPEETPSSPPGWTLTSSPDATELYLDDEHRRLVPSFLGFKWCWYPTGRCFVLAIPNWFPIATTFIAAAAPWIKWRFTLRTLLIATTLVAVVLGLVVWGTR